MSNRLSTATMTAVLLFGLAAGARAELIDPTPTPAQDAIQAPSQPAESVPAPRARPQPAAHRVVVAPARHAPALSFLQPQPATCLACTRYLLIAGIGF
jgi:hypothetical protein